MNFGIKIIHKILTSKIQERVERRLFSDQVELIPGIWDWFNIQRPTSETHNVVISSDAEKHLTDVNSQLWLKTVSEAGIEGNFLGLMWGNYKRTLQLASYSMVEDGMFSPKFGDKAEMSTLTPPVQLCNGRLATSLRQGKERKGISG